MGLLVAAIVVAIAIAIVTVTVIAFSGFAGFNAFNAYYRRRLKHHVNVEGYAARWNATDARVRGGISVDEYIASVRMPTLRERYKLLRLVTGHGCKRHKGGINAIDNIQAIQAINNIQNIQAIQNIPWRFLIFSRGEGGLPHTHGQFIMIPERMMLPDSFIDATTLFHERVHIYQRYFPIECIDAIVNGGSGGNGSNGSDSSIAITGFVYPEDNHRANPDTSRILFGDIRPRWKPDAVSLTDITDTRDHPFELMAYGL